jgi:hypothetical protein
VFVFAGGRHAAAKSAALSAQPLAHLDRSLEGIVEGSNATAPFAAVPARLSLRANIDPRSAPAVIGMLREKSGVR